MTALTAFAEAPRTVPQGITGDNVAWTEASALAAGSAERRNANFVAALTYDSPANRFCTGFLVASDLLMTNAHCFSDDGTAAGFNADNVPGTKAVFNYESGVDSSLRETYQCDTLVRVNTTIDATLLECRAGPIGARRRALPGNRWGYSWLYTSSLDAPIAAGDRIYVIHQNCVDNAAPPAGGAFTNRACSKFKKLSRGTLLNFEGAIHLRHDADTMPGSSGAPIFSAATHRVIGLNKCCTDRATGDAPALGNKGTILSEILAFFEAHVERLDPASGITGTRVRVFGRNFGDRQGPQRVVLGGHGVSVEARVRSWSNEMIEIVVPNDRRLAPNWYYVGIQRHGLWVSNINVNFTVRPRIVGRSLTANSNMVELELFAINGERVLQRLVSDSTQALEFLSARETKLPNGVYFYVLTEREPDGRMVRSELKKVLVNR
jgi:hypothetical protein